MRSSAKKPSEVIAVSAPGSSGTSGRPPVATTMCLAACTAPPMLTRPGASTRARSRKEHRAPSLQVLQVNAAQLFDISIAPRLERRPVMTRGLEREAVVGRIHQGVRHVGCVIHDFLRHAADVDAGAAEGPRFRDRGARAVAGGALGAGEAAAAAADHDQIPRLRHALPARVPRGPMIYSNRSWPGSSCWRSRHSPRRS